MAENERLATHISLLEQLIPLSEREIAAKLNKACEEYASGRFETMEASAVNAFPLEPNRVKLIKKFQNHFYRHYLVDRVTCLSNRLAKAFNETSQHICMAYEIERATIRAVDILTEAQEDRRDSETLNKALTSTSFYAKVSAYIGDRCTKAQQKLEKNRRPQVPGLKEMTQEIGEIEKEVDELQEVRRRASEAEKSLQTFRNSLARIRWATVSEGQRWERARFGVSGAPYSSTDECVALFYQNGQPVMGSIWKDKDENIRCRFGYNGYQFDSYDHEGFQILLFNERLPGKESVQWVNYDIATSHDSSWIPFVIQHGGTDSAPCLIKDESGTAHMGKISLAEEKASFPCQHSEYIITGPSVKTSCMVLCKKR